MIAFETHAGKEINLDAVEAVMLGKHAEPRFLDVVTGRVESEPSVTRMEIPVISKERFEKEMRSFIDMMAVWENDESDACIIEKLTALLSGKEVYDKAMQILQTDEAWMIGWREWISTSVWEEMRAWLLSADNGIVEVATFNCSCALCHDMAQGMKGNERIRVDWNLDNMNEDGNDKLEK